MVPVNAQFSSAPLGRRVIWAAATVMTAVTVAAIFGIVAVTHGLRGRVDPAVRILTICAPFLGILIVVPTFLIERARTASFRIEDNVLVLGSKRYPLASLTEVTRDPTVLKGALRIMGNGGLGSIRGRFWSRRMGRFEAFLTDPELAVALRWRDRTVVVSPADPEFFIHSARSAAALPLAGRDSGRGNG